MTPIDFGVTRSKVKVIGGICVVQNFLLNTFSVLFGIFQQKKNPIYVLSSGSQSVCLSENFVTKVEKVGASVSDGHIS